MFKRVFAAMLAASSVMAMSGVAMATKKAPENGKSHEASKTPVQSGRKVMKLKKIKARGKRKNKKNKQVDVLVVPSNLAFKYNPDSDDDEQSKLDCKTEHFYTAAMGGKDMLSQDCCNDEYVLKTTNQIRRLKHIHSIHNLKDCPKGEELELVNALISWAKADNITVKRNIAVAVGDLAPEGFLNDLPQEKKPEVLSALVNCVDRDPSIKQDVAWAFKRLLECGFVNENENSEEILKLREILNDCKDSCDVEPHLDIVDDSDSCDI